MKTNIKFISALILMILPILLYGGEKRKPFYVKILPDNNRFVVAEKTGKILLMNIPEMKVIREYNGDVDLKLKSVKVSEDGKWIGAYFKKGKLWVFNIESGESTFTLNVEEKPIFAFAPNKENIIAVFDNKINIRNL